MIKLTKWLSNYKAGKYKTQSGAHLNKLGLVDWMCTSHELTTRMCNIGALLSELKSSKKLDINSAYIDLKSYDGKLGGIFDIVLIYKGNSTSELVNAIEIDNPLKSKLYTVHSGDGNSVVFETDSQSELTKWFNKK